MVVAEVPVTRLITMLSEGVVVVNTAASPALKASVGLACGN